MKLFISTLFILLLSYNANSSDLQQVALKADKLKTTASRCYLSIPKIYQSSLARMYLQGNEMHRNGVNAIKARRLSLARTYLVNAINIYDTFIGSGRNVGGRSC